MPGRSSRARRFALVVLALASLAAAAPPASRDVRRAWDALEQALVARDAGAATGLLTEASLAEWARVRRAALSGRADEIEALAPGPRLLVLALRHAEPVFLLREGTPEELVAHAVRSGLADRDALAVVEIGDVAALGASRAAAVLLASGMPSGARAGFARERGAWRLDLPSSLESVGRVLSQAARAAGRSESELIVSLIAAVSGEPVRASIWEPMLRESGPGS